MAGAIGAGRERGSDAAAAAAAKAQAAREVCAASAAFASCPHRRRSPRGAGSRPHFVDWYLVLAIGEAASEDAVRRRYRQLAHAWRRALMESVAVPVPPGQYVATPPAGAHACLTDKARRRAYDAERRASFCAACHDRHATRSSAAAGGRLRATTEKQTTAAAGAAARSKQPRAAPAAQALREVQNRMRDECRVIDGCLRANNAAACARRRQSFPLFDPSDRRSFPDYPHVRPPPFGNAEFWRFEERLGRADQNQRWCRGGGGGESPVYQIRTAAAECTDRTKRAW
uniref:J domain-containing protein n=1 Tax=Setaria italica TaxID=4555 RepID=K4AK03_SETIT